jgi:hypothetical protein
VPIGSVLRLTATVVRSSPETNQIHSQVSAEVVNVSTGETRKTNDFYFSFMRDDGEPLTRRIVPEVSVSTKTSPGPWMALLWLWTSSDFPSPMLFHSELLRIDAVAGGRSPDGDGQRDARPPAALMQLRPQAGVVEMYLCPPTICPARLCSEQGPLVLACLAIQDLGEQNSFRDCGGRRLQASRARARGLRLVTLQAEHGPLPLPARLEPQRYPLLSCPA